MKTEVKEQITETTGIEVQKSYWETKPTEQIVESLSVLENAKKYAYTSVIVGDTGCGKSYAKVITVKNLYAKRYRTMEFDGRWLASFGNPDVSGSWLVWGKSGSGKTTFLLMLSKYLTQFERVLYLS